MQEIKDRKTVSYDTNDGFMVDIEIDAREGMYRAFLSHKGYREKMYMFGAPIEQQLYGQFLDIVEGNLDKYIPDYKDWYFDKE